ncbi:MAG: DUF1730 domain-containing protein [Planctomycetia bacterium]|nr:DUF1730 domain-containing protein [Planctomycetia bacterium]
MTLFQAIYQKPLNFGADLVGIVQAGEAKTFSHYCNWLKQGNQASMNYLEKNLVARQNPCSILSNVRSMIIIAVSMNEIAKATNEIRSNKQFYNPEFLTSRQKSNEHWGKVLFYGAQLDYHIVIRQKLSLLKNWILSQLPKIDARVVVDTAPLLEKEWASRAGLGFIGRNSLLIHPKFGSRLFLGTLLLSASIDELRSTPVKNKTLQKAKPAPPNDFVITDPKMSNASTSLSNYCSDNLIKIDDSPIFGIDSDIGCGKCRRCLDNCPTDAILENKTIDARRCLNYWTIEHKSDEIPKEIRVKLKDRLFGCDLCQQVCPWNRFEQKWQPIPFNLTEIQKMSDSEFQENFGKTPISRIKRIGLQRNAQWLEDC